MWGRVTVPARLFVAVDEPESPWRTIHRVCGNPLSHPRVCKTCGVELAGYGESARAVEVEPGRFVIVENTELAQLPGADRLKLDRFYWAGDVDPVVMLKHYWLDPWGWDDTTVLGAYTALYGALVDSEHVGVGQMLLGSYETLALVRPSAGQLMLATIVDETRLRPPDLGLPKAIERHELEPGVVKKARELVAAKSRTRFRPRLAPTLPGFVEGKKDAGRVVGSGPDLAAPDDLADALERSL